MSTLEKQPLTLAKIKALIDQKKASQLKFSDIEYEVREIAWNARGENFEVLLHLQDPKSQKTAGEELRRLIAEIPGTYCLQG